MARVLFGSHPVSGHVRPGLPLARELTARGHEVLWYTSPRFKTAVEGSGATSVPFVRGLDLDEADLDATFPGRAALSGVRQLRFDMVSLFIDTIPAHVEDLRAVMDASPPDLVVVESAFTAAALLAEERGIPWAVYGITPLTARSVDCAPMGFGLPPRPGLLGRTRNRVLNAAVQRVVFAAAQRRFEQVRNDLGAPPADEFFLDYTLSRTPVYLQGTIPAFEYPRRDLPDNVHLVGLLLPEAPGSRELPTWWGELDQDRPVVLVTQGTVAVEPGLLLEPALTGLADLDVLVVATSGGAPPERVLGGRLPDNARLVDFVPFVDLLPHVDVLVTNGGYGGTQQALAHGIPVLAAGVTEGKNEVAARVAWSGAGIDLRTQTPTAARVREGVQALLGEPGYRLRAGELAEEYARHDAPRTGVDLLEGLLPTRRAQTRST